MPLSMRIAGLVGGLIGALTIPLFLWFLGARMGIPEWTLPFCCGFGLAEIIYLIKQFREGE